VGRVLKQAIIGTTLSCVVAALTGCTYLIPPEPTPLVETSPPKVVRRVPVEQKVVRRAPVEQKVVKAAPKPVVKKKVIKPVEEESAPPVIAPLGAGGSGGGGGGGW
jgi:hypothetical protein